MDDTIYKGVVVGCGNIGALFEAEPNRPKPASHAGALRENGETELSGLVDNDQEKLKAASILFPGVPTFTDLTRCLSEVHPDIVIIATPPNTHLELTRECVVAGVPMLVCEKPVTASTADADELLGILSGSSTTFVLNYHRRFYPLFVQVRNEIAEGKIGDIEQVTCYYSNGLRTNGSHSLDAVRFLLNDTYVSAYGMMSEKNTTHPEGDINIDGIVRTSLGVPVVLQSFDQSHYGINDIRIFGTKGAVTFTDYGLHLERLESTPSIFKGVNQLKVCPSEEVETPSATEGVLREVIACMKDGRKPVSSVESGTAVLTVIDALTESAGAEGQTVMIQV